MTNYLACIFLSHTHQHTTKRNNLGLLACIYFLRFRSCRGLWKDPLGNRSTFLLLRPRGREYKPYELQWNVSRASIRLTYTCWVTFGMCLFLMVCISACVFLYISPPWLVSFRPVPLLGLCLFPSRTPHIWHVSFYCQFLMNFSKKRHMLLHTSKYFTTFALDFSSFHFWNKHEPSQKLRQLK